MSGSIYTRGASNDQPRAGDRRYIPSDATEPGPDVCSVAIVEDDVTHLFYGCGCGCSNCTGPGCGCCAGC